jgi:hypothetical protein
MRIKEIRQDGRYYIVELEPNRLERIFGKKPGSIKLKDSGDSYMFGGQTIYIDEEGNKSGNGNWIAVELDKWRRKNTF